MTAPRVVSTSNKHIDRGADRQTSDTMTPSGDNLALTCSRGRNDSDLSATWQHGDSRKFACQGYRAGGVLMVVFYTQNCAVFAGNYGMS